MSLSLDRKRRNERAGEQIERVLRQIEEHTLTLTRKLGTADATRRAAERAAHKLVYKRRYLLWRRHTSIQLRVLRCMITLALASNPALQRRAGLVASYYSKNYAWEWLHNEVTAPARSTARDMILRAGDSEWGDTPVSGPMAYVIVHHRELRIRHPSDYSELYTRALRMEEGRFFQDAAEPLRRALGLAALPDLRQKALQDAPETQPG